MEFVEVREKGYFFNIISFVLDKICVYVILDSVPEKTVLFIDCGRGNVLHGQQLNLTKKLFG